MEECPFKWMKSVHIFSPLAFYFPSLSRAETVTSFVVAVLPRNVISFSFNESCSHHVGKFSRMAGAPALVRYNVSSADNLQKFPLLCNHVTLFFLHGIWSIECEERNIIEFMSIESQYSQSNFAKSFVRVVTLKSITVKFIMSNCTQFLIITVNRHCSYQYIVILIKTIWL